jgi:ABC-2 type transport system permease protein
MVRSIAHKEFLSTLRDRRFAVLSLLMLALLLTATLVGRRGHAAMQAERAVAQETVSEQFHHQPGRHPHRVVHYGTFAFRPRAALSFLDNGLDSFTGAVVYLEGHQQNSVNFSPAQQAGSLIRFGELSVAFVLQTLVPLLLIFLCFGAFTEEREAGTLRLLLSQGVTLRQVAWGKIAGYSWAAALVVAPALGLASMLLLSGEATAGSPDRWARLVLFGLSYTLYFFVIIVGAVVVSARQAQSRAALVTLLGCWMLGCLILPKATANLGAGLFPAITKAQLDAAVHEEAQHGINGHDPQDQRAAALKAGLLKKYGVATEQELPVSVAGVTMAEGEAYSSRVYQHPTTIDGTGWVRFCPLRALSAGSRSLSLPTRAAPQRSASQHGLRRQRAPPRREHLAGHPSFHLPSPAASLGLGLPGPLRAGFASLGTGPQLARHAVS